MRYVARPQVQTEGLARSAASQNAWLLQILFWFCDVLDLLPPALRQIPLVRDFIATSKAQIARDLRRAVRHLTHILFLSGIVRMNFTQARIRDRRFPGAPAQGLRSGRGSGCMRVFRRVLAGMNAGSLRQRAARLAAAINNLGSLSDRMLKRMRRIWRIIRGAALILATPETPHVAGAAAPTPALADTS